MKCGERGHVTATGAPCGQTIGATAVGCLWHSRTPDQRRLLALKGGIASRMRTALPASYQIPEFTDEASILTFARELARMALKDDVDLRRVSEARGAASLALSAVSARSQAKLVDALLRLEHGGAAVALLAQFQAGQANGPRRPLPGRVLTLPTTTSPEPA
jgi:hypothetical protein